MIKFVRAVHAWLDAHQTPEDPTVNGFQIEAKVLSLLWNFRARDSDKAHSEGRRGALCGIEELRAVSGTSL